MSTLLVTAHSNDSMPGGWERNPFVIVALQAGMAAVIALGILGLVLPPADHDPTYGPLYWQLWVPSLVSLIIVDRAFRWAVGRRRARIDVLRGRLMARAFDDAVLARRDVARAQYSRHGARWAHWQAADRGLLDDNPRFRAFIDRDLREGLSRDAERLGLAITGGLEISMREDGDFFIRNTVVVLAETRVRVAVDDADFARRFWCYDPGEYDPIRYHGPWPTTMRKLP